VAGDRRFADDHAIVTGFARYKGEPVLVVGHHKGSGGDTKDRVFRNFGYAKPEGYRKALRAMKLAERFGHPVLSIVDTPAAFPGDAAEERGQAEAIARNIEEMTRLGVPIVVVISGEGGSGGALAIAVGDSVLMLEHAVYTVIPPEGCAAILWRDASRSREASAALRLTSGDLLALGLIDEVIAEPPGGAHADPAAAIEGARGAIRRHLAAARGLSTQELLRRRYEKYRTMGYYEEIR
jgi:acetyl-CoA carboxylase carboxyl transferase subunit alpha